MWGAIAGAGLGAVGSIFGGISAAKAMKKQKEDLENQRKENRDWYDRRYNEDSTQRADAQRLLTITAERLKSDNRRAAGTAAVMGGTTESAAAAKEANNKVLADTASQINVQGEARKENIENQYREKDAQLRDRLNELEMQRAQNTANAIKGVAGSMSGLGGM